MEVNYTKSKAQNPNSRLSARALEDYNLVLKAVEGSQQAYTMLMNRYQQSVFHTILKMLNNREDAHDLTQEAFTKAFKKLHLYTPTYAFSTWLFKIAINNCIDFIRKKKLQMLSIDEPVEQGSKQDYSNNLKSTSLDPEERYIRKQRVDVMRQLMSKLTPKYRLMLEMRFFEELTYQEIANELDIPLGTVKAQLYRAKELLNNILNRDQVKNWF